MQVEEVSSRIIPLNRTEHNTHLKERRPDGVRRV